MDYEGKRKKQVERKGEYKKHFEIVEGQVVELGHVLFEIFHCEVDMVHFVRFEKGTLSEVFNLKSKESILGVGVDALGGRGIELRLG